MSIGASSDQAVMSAPAQNARSPAPVTTRTRIASEASTSERIASKSASIAGAIAFRFSARFSVTVATGPSTASRTRSLIGRPPRA